MISFFYYYRLLLFLFAVVSKIHTKETRLFIHIAVTVSYFFLQKYNL